MIFDESKNIEHIKHNTNNKNLTWITDDDTSVFPDDKEETENTNIKVTEEIENGNIDVNSNNKNEQIEEETETETNVRRSTRTKRQPVRYGDYIMVHIALSAESFIDDVPENLENAKNRSDYRYWKAAVEEELKTLKKNNTWTLVRKPENVKVIDNKWVFRLKRHPDGQIKGYKARLVAKGFMQRKGFNYEETYAPVARLTTIRTLVAVINYKNLKTLQMDVKSAFLHGSIDEEIYMRKPEGFEENDSCICKLNKALYGLKQAPLNWNNRFNEFAEGQQFKRSEHDPCLYVKHYDQSVLYLLIYVDDIIIASDDSKKIEELKTKLCETFEMSDLGDVTQFLGINIRSTENGIYLNQRNYLVNLLERFGMSDCKPCKTPMDVNGISIETKDDDNSSEAKEKPIRELIGCLSYIMLATRPDLSVAINHCS